MLERDRNPHEANQQTPSAETTQDLRPVRPRTALPLAEERTRTRGPWMIASGLGLVVMTVIIAAVWHLGFHREMPMVFVLPLYVFGFCSLLLGFMEFLSRPVRETHLHTLEQMRRLEKGLTLLADMLPEEMKQQFYRGYGRCAEEFSAATGTDGTRPERATGEVLRLRRRG